MFFSWLHTLHAYFAAVDDAVNVKFSVALVQIHLCIPAAIRQLSFFVFSVSQTDQRTDRPHTYSLPPNLAALTQEDH